MDLKADSRYPVAFPTLSPEIVAEIEGHTEVVSYPDGEYIWRAGDIDYGFYIVKAGTVEVVDDSSGRHNHVVDHEPGGFTGDIDLLSGRPAVVSGIARDNCRLLKLSMDCLRTIVKQRPDLSDIVLKAFMLRRSWLLETGFEGIRVIGSRFSAETLSIREFLGRNRVPFTWLDLEGNDEVQLLLQTLDVCVKDTPVVLLGDGTILRNPPLSLLGEHMGIRRDIDHAVYDVVVVGAGPAGLAASVYASSDGLNTLLLDRIAPGGQAGTSSKIENYLGFPTGLSGQDLANRALVQSEKFGTSISVPNDVVQLECGDGMHRLMMEGGEEVHARAVILATGAQYRKLDVPGFDRLEMSGIYYAATGMEAQLCRDQEVAIVGGGNSAGQAAVYLSTFARKVWLVVRGESLDMTMSSYLSQRIAGISNVEVLTQCEVVATEGDQTIESVEVRNRLTQAGRCLDVGALFVFIGANPHTEWLTDRVKLDRSGFVVTGPSAGSDPAWPLERAPLFLETSCPGVFAAGDVRSGSIKRVASAVGEGSMAVALVHEYLQLSSIPKEKASVR